MQKFENQNIQKIDLDISSISNGFNSTLKLLEPSGIAKMVMAARELKHKCIHLEIGDVDYQPPPEIKSGVEEAFANGHTHYPPFQGDEELLQIIKNELHDEGFINIDKSNILIVSGGSMGLYISLRSILNTGDEVIIPEPAWPHLKSMVLLAGAKPIMIPTSAKDNYFPTVEMLQSYLSKRTRVVLLNTPCNPTGRVYNQMEINNIINFAQSNNLVILSDEEYIDFRYDSREAYCPGYTYPATITCRSFSKRFASAGLRLGFIVAPSEWIQLIGLQNLYSAMYASSIVQQCIKKALTSTSTFVPDMVSIFEKRMVCISTLLNQIPGLHCPHSEGSLYVWVDCRGVTTDDLKLANDLLERANVVTVPGSAFGASGSGFLRISLAADISLLEEACKRIKLALENSNWRMK